MRIVVTGGAGFIGSHITDAYIKEGHTVIVIDNLSTGKRDNLNPKARFYRCDVRNIKALDAVFRKERIDVVCHHAAQMDVRRSVADPVYDANVNIIGVINLLECMRKYKTKKIIFASSGGTFYGEVGARAPKEDAPARPDSPYGVSKCATEYYLRCYNSLYGIKYTILRYGNVYGPRQDPHGEAGVVAIFSNKLIGNETALIFGDGKQMRDYVYVGDVVNANVKALSKGDNQRINIGTGKTTSVNQLFSILARAYGSPKKPIYKPKRAGELYKSVLDISKARRVLGWSPAVSITQGLEHTLAYFINKIK